jgi:hypothetical protein
MPSVNPGPATTQTPNLVAGLAVVNTNFKPAELLANPLRLLAVARSIPILGLGDIAVVPVINTSSFIVTAVYFTNALSATGASASAAALTVSLNGGPAVTGTSLVASAALTNLTGSNKYVSATVAEAANTSVQTLTMGTSGGPSNNLYLNATVVSAAAATMDMFVYGYDIT